MQRGGVNPLSKKVLWSLIAGAVGVALLVTGLILFLPKGEPSAPPAPTEPGTQETVRQCQIIGAETVGAWARDRAGDSKIGPGKSYDEFIGTYWNPQAPGNYQGEPGIVYLLNGYYDITEFAAYFANREYFFKLYVSTDCKEFTQVFEVNAENMAQVYDKDYCCSITGLDAKNVAFFKLVFTGSNSSDNNTYISLRHVKFDGTWLKEGPASIPIEKQEDVKKKSIIADYLITGSWVRDREGDSSIGPKMTFDGNDYTVWNPQANGKYQGNPGITYMLNAYYDLNSLRIITEKREYYFDVYTSADGLEFTQIAQITGENYTQYYNGFTCTLENLTCQDVGYVRLVFTGSHSVDNNTYLSLAEVEPAGQKLDKPAPTEIPDTEPKVGKNSIAAHRVSGSWVRDREDMESLSPKKTYDKNAYSYWNPQANGSYKGNPGITYMLDGYYDIAQIQLIFGTREYYFDVYTSADGYSFQKVVSVNSGNMTQYYQNLTVTLSDLNIKNVGYLKLVFTGSHSKDNNTYVSLMETVVTGQKLDKEAPTTIPNVDEKVAATKIRDHKIVGSWIRDREDTDSLAPYRSYDENLYAGWNPQTNSGYKGNPGIIYRLKSFYDISKIKLTFDKREYFFELYTSTDGTSFNLAVKVTSENMSQYYKGYACTLSDLGVKNAGYIKLVFTGSNSSDNNTYISLMEVELSGTKLSGTPGKIPAQQQEPQATATIIADHKTVGSWLRDREDTPSLAPKNTYDENLYTAWNPQTDSNYAGQPGIVYMLKGYYDLSEIKLTFDKREYFFEIYTSADGVEYTQLAKVTVENYTDFYQGFVCKFQNPEVTGVGFIKLVFTGSNSGDNNTFISLMEVELSGTRQGEDAPAEIPAEPTEPEEPTQPDEPTEPEETELMATITGHTIVGSWANDRAGDSKIGPQVSYDGDDNTKWNPAVTGYTSEAAIIYTLDKQYDINKLSLVFGSRKHYVTVSVSTDGETYTEIATVNSGNADQYYTELTCVLNDLTAQNVQYVKVSFIGTENGTTWISLQEIRIYGIEATGEPEEPESSEPEEPTEPEVTEPEVTEPEEPTEPDEPTEPEVTEPEAVQAVITGHTIAGSWANDRAGDSKIGPQVSYDGDDNTKWNPAVTGYTTEASIIYTLDKAYDLTKLELLFGTRKHYIKVSVSSDGEQYTELAAINSGNAAEYFDGLNCVVGDLTAENVKYVKITFIGTENGTTWISLQEIRIYGVEATGEPEEPIEPEPSEPDEPTEPEEPTESEVTAVISAYEVIGTWVRDREGDSKIGPQKSFDADSTSIWNPQATNYQSGEGIIYTLDQAYDLKKIQLTFGTRQYYFTLYVSADGETYTQIMEVNAANAGSYFTELVCTLDELADEKIRYVKILFTGSANGTTYISLADVKITGKEPIAE